MGLINSKPKQNYIINGDMTIAQRGTSFAAIATAAYSLDRWQYGKSGSMVHTVSQSSDAPTSSQSGYNFLSSLDATVTTAQVSIGVNDENFLRQSIEGYNFNKVAKQKPFTISFWVKATVTGTYCVAFRNSGSDRSYIAEYSVNSGNTWEFKTLTIAASPSAGTWDYTNGIGLQVLFVMAAGTNRQTTAGSWQTGNFIASSNQVNAVGTISNIFRITGVMLNEGPSAQPFRLFGNSTTEELNECLRYYEQTGVVSSSTTVIAGNSFTDIFPFKAFKRTTPTFVLSGNWYTSGGVPSTFPQTGTVTPWGFRGNIVAVATSVYADIALNIDAEL